MEKPNITQNVLPEHVVLFPRLERAAHFITGLFQQMHFVPDYTSDHYRGAEATLESELYGTPPEPRR